MVLSRKAALALGVAALAVALAASAPPQDSSTAATAAGIALDAGDAAQAEQLATQIIQDETASPADRADAFFTRGLAREQLGARDDALVDFTQALWLNVLPRKQAALVYYDRGVTLEEVGRPHDAMGDYIAAIRLAPRFGAALNNEANLYRREGQLAKARLYYRRALAAHDPQAEYPWYGLAQIAQAQHDRLLARSYYHRALAANPQYQDAADSLAALLPHKPQPAPVVEAQAQASPASAARGQPEQPGSGTTPMTTDQQAAAVAAPDDSAPQSTPASEPVETAQDTAAAPAPAAQAEADQQQAPVAVADASPPDNQAVPAVVPTPRPHAPRVSMRVAATAPAPQPAAQQPAAPALTEHPDLRATIVDAGAQASHPQQDAEVAPPADPAPAQAVTPREHAAAVSRGPQVQLGAWRNQADAADGWNRFVAAVGDLAHNLTPHIVSADLPGKGRYWRLRASPTDGQSASALCTALRAKGIACLPVNG